MVVRGDRAAAGGQQSAGDDSREQVLSTCAAKPGAVEDYPFGDNVAVFKVGGMMFALVSLTGEPGSVSLKCDPELAVVLRSRHRAVEAGYHLSKRHWNTVTLDGSRSTAELDEMLDHSYQLVVDQLPEADRDRLRSGLQDGSE